MNFTDSSGWIIFARSASVALPVAWLVSRIQLNIVGWMFANADAANPVRSPVREFIFFALSLPIPPIWHIASPLVRWNNDLIPFVACNAICWELLLAPFTRGTLGNFLRAANILGEIFWPNSGLSGAFGL